LHLLGVTFAEPSNNLDGTQDLRPKDTFEIAQRRHASSLGVPVVRSKVERTAPVSADVEAPLITSSQIPLTGLGRTDVGQFLQRALDDFEVPKSLLMRFSIVSQAIRSVCD
jgi:hypothetical protein